MQKRYKRFFADIKTDNNETIITHCPNTGKMTGLTEENTLVVYTKTLSSLGYQWQFAFIDNTWVGVNTMLANKVFLELFEENKLKLFKKNLNSFIKSEPNIKPITGDNHRLDFFIENTELNIDLIKKNFECNQYIKYNKNNPTFVEVKHAHWKVGNTCYFPDCITERGTNQINSTRKINTENYNLLIVFMVVREDCKKVTASKEVDPAFYSALYNLIKHGAMVCGIACHVTPTSISAKETIEVIGFLEE